MIVWSKGFEALDDEMELLIEANGAMKVFALYSVLSVIL